MTPACEYGVALTGKTPGDRSADVVAGPNDRDRGIAPGSGSWCRPFARSNRVCHHEYSSLLTAGDCGANHSRRHLGQAIGPNQAPPATAAALSKPKAARATARAAKTPDRPPVQYSAGPPPPTAIKKRAQLASNGHSSRPAPCEAK